MSYETVTIPAIYMSLLFFNKNNYIFTWRNYHPAKNHISRCPLWIRKATPLNLDQWEVSRSFAWYLWGSSLKRKVAFLHLLLVRGGWSSQGHPEVWSGSHLLVKVELQGQKFTLAPWSHRAWVFLDFSYMRDKYIGILFNKLLCKI